MEFAIIGGGITGLSLAIALHYRGIDVTIYEQAPRFGEIGAGVSFQPNAVQAMKVCHNGIYDAFEKVCSRNLWPSKQKVWFDYYDGYNDGEETSSQGPAFTISNNLGQNGVHRAKFLDELVKLLPPNIARFGKRVVSYAENDHGRLTLSFADGSTATTDAILACDGIKSKIRQVLFGPDHPCALPSYTHKYAYRALVPMEDAIAAIGDEKAQNACMHMGPGGHVLTFPVNHGRTMNVVAFHTTANDWSNRQKLTAPATREDALKDFEGFGATVTNILKLARPELEVWAIFDLGDNPVPTFARGNVCLVGDAAHATSPHHGAGAGMCIEDAAVLAELLAHQSITSKDDVRTAFAVFDACRKERGQWLVQSSRHIGDCYEWQGVGVDDNFAKIESEINLRNRIIAEVDVVGMCRSAKDRLQMKESFAAL